MLEILGTVGIALSVVWGSVAAVYLGPAAVWRLRANREARSKAAIEASREEMRVELEKRTAVLRSITQTNRRSESEIDRLGQAAYDKRLEDDGLLDPGQPTLSSTLRRPRKGV